MALPWRSASCDGDMGTGHRTGVLRPTKGICFCDGRAERYDQLAYSCGRKHLEPFQKRTQHPGDCFRGRALF